MIGCYVLTLVCPPRKRTKYSLLPPTPPHTHDVFPICVTPPLRLPPPPPPPPYLRNQVFSGGFPLKILICKIYLVFDCCGVPDRDGALRFATVSPGERVSTRPFFEFKNLKKNFSPQLSIASRSPFDKARELLMREPHISFSDLHRFHEHSTQRLQIF